ncbi:hypothetical protein GCM10007103_22080 [Salinimicrobium marinum]|uniref:Uncharacterized protein n=1 Tax=Salinimicrobium marinum TaxID=680283 RepID=A0A918SGN0_9FLAO|nr:DUF6140 family protein [Salinimicrobium marinum]GHA40219.1 hypothetical protein GCM10007103_22080 [Salinimicrobium marinum]
MALYKITTKRKFVNGNLLIDKGMTVQDSSFAANPLDYDEGTDVNNALIIIYGIDLKPQGLLSTTFLEVEKI